MPSDQGHHSPSPGTSTPPNTTVGAEGQIVHFPSASVLEIPETLPPPSYGSGSASPNIPPNPPTSPVEGVSTNVDARSPSKLNVNAPAFVPSNFSIVDEMGGGRSLRYIPTKDGEISGASDDAMGTNNRHMRTGMSNAGSTGDSEKESSTTAANATPTTSIQTKTQVTSLSTGEGDSTGHLGGRQSTNVTSSPLDSQEVVSGGGAMKSSEQRSSLGTQAITSGRTSPQSGTTAMRTSSLSDSVRTGDSNSLPSSSNHTRENSADSQAGKASALALTLSQVSLSPHSHKDTTSPHTTTTTPNSTARTSRSSSTSVTPSGTAQTTPTRTTPTQLPPTSITNASTPIPTSSTTPKPKSWASIVGGSLGANQNTSSSPSSQPPGPAMTVSGQKASSSASTASAVESGCPVEGCKPQLDPVKCNSQLRSLGGKFVCNDQCTPGMCHWARVKQP